MSQLELCDKLRSLQKSICNTNYEDTKTATLCKELDQTIKETNCPECPLRHPTNSYKIQSAPPGCGIGVFTSPG